MIYNETDKGKIFFESQSDLLFGGWNYFLKNQHKIDQTFKISGKIKTLKYQINCSDYSDAPITYPVGLKIWSLGSSQNTYEGEWTGKYKKIHLLINGAPTWKHLKHPIFLFYGKGMNNIISTASKSF